MSIPVIDPSNAVNDSAMPLLRNALDPCQVEREFSRKLKKLTHGEGRIKPLFIRVLRHKPLKRCVIEYVVNVERPGHTLEQATLIGKVRARRFGKSGFRLLTSLWEAGFQSDSPDGISVPDPIGTIPKFQMWLQRKVPGRLATELLPVIDDSTGELTGESLARRIAEAARKVHELAVPVDASHTMRDELRILHNRVPLVSHEDPRWRPRIDRLLSACQHLADETTVSTPRTIHRDYYADQIVVQGDRIFLLDFDLCCNGDPAVDIGNFLAHITEQSLRHSGRPDAWSHLERALNERFIELAGETIRPVIAAYKTLTLVRHIYISTLFPDRRPFTGQLIDLCEDRLKKHLTPHSPLCK